jgi:hypothetical protein
MAGPTLESTLEQVSDTLTELTKEVRGRRQKTVLEIERRTPFNPTGGPRPKLKWEAIYYNDFKCSDKRLTNAEIEGLNKVTPGRYLDRRVEVIKKDRNLYVRVKNKDMMERMRLMGDAPTFEILITKILAEAEEIKKRRKNGDFEDE